VTYKYEVRAEDAATNIGQRSATASAKILVPDITPPTTTATTCRPTALRLDERRRELRALRDRRGQRGRAPSVASTWYTIDGGDARLYIGGLPVVVAAPVRIGSPTGRLTARVNEETHNETHNVGYVNIDKARPATTADASPSGWTNGDVT